MKLSKIRSLRALVLSLACASILILETTGVTVNARSDSSQFAERLKSGKSYKIDGFGAVGDGQTLNTKAIQAAIERCAAEGGGVIVVPKGTFRTGSIFLRQGCDLQVEKDGILKGTSNQDDYPQVKTRWEGVERMWTAALVNAQGMTNLKISGDGMIDGSGDEWVAKARPPGTVLPGQRLGRPRLMAVENSQHVVISNLHFKNEAVWCLHILYSEYVTVENLNIRAEHNIPSSDGIDIDSSRHVRVRHCDIDVNDDCISIKSGKDEDGLRVNRPSEDIIIENCRFGYGHGGVAMGSETSGGIRNVEVRNNIAEDNNWAPVRFKTQPSRGGVVENITFRNFQLRNVRRAFEINMEWTSSRGVLAPASKVLPILRNVRLINVIGTSQSGGLIHGLAGSPVSDVKFKNCKITARESLVVEHARKIDFSGLKLIVEKGDPIVKTDVE